MTDYRFPLRAHLGYLVARLLPACVTGWFYVAALDALEERKEFLTVVNVGYGCTHPLCIELNGLHDYIHDSCIAQGYRLFDAVSEIGIETARRYYYGEYLGAGPGQAGDAWPRMLHQRSRRTPAIR